jgi:hypothetical protein
MTAQRDFEAFHAENPHVYQLFERFTFEAISAGRKRFSARTVAERIRWYTSVETRDPAGFKLNNNWAPFYARLFHERWPAYDGLFELRKSVADVERYQLTG